MTINSLMLFLLDLYYTHKIYPIDEVFHQYLN